MIPFSIAASSNTPVASCVADSVVHDSITGKTPIYFPVNSSEVVTDYDGNKSALQHLNGQLDNMLADTTVTLRSLTIHGYSSIDGPYSNNDSIAKKRTKSLADYVKHRSNISDGIITTLITPEDWKGFEQFVEKSSTDQLPHKEQILRIINSTREPDAKEWLIKSTYPEDYKYLIDNCMPKLRRSDYTIKYVKTSHIAISKAVATPETTATVFVADTTAASVQEEPKRKSLLFALKTNMLYDAALIPNLGIEVYMGKRWTIALDWFYTWFSSNNRHRYWQAYGGYLGVRKYLDGNNSKFKIQNSKFPTGHHLGAYILGLTYDVEWGGKGYQASKFGFGGGLEYGYSKMIGRRWSIDFSVGVGFQDGEYKEYEPANDDTGHYIWLATKKRHWWGPTKAEVSLKWLFGTKGNKHKKGGKR